MGSQPTGRPAHFVDRTRILVVLAAPFLILTFATLASWPWRAMDLPGTVGTLTPPGIFFLALAVAAAMYALQRKLPMGMITWVPAGQGAIVLLATGFVADATEAFVGIAIIIVYSVIFLIVLGLAMMVSVAGTQLGMAFVIFFVMTQAARFPLFGPDAETAIGGAPFLTIVAFLLAVVELTALAWLTRRLMEAPDEETSRVVLLMAGLTLAHGFVAAWEEPLLRGDLTFVGFIEQWFRWVMLAGIQLGMAWGILRLRKSWTTEPRWAEPEPERDRPSKPPMEATIIEDSLPRRRPRRRS